MFAFHLSPYYFMYIYIYIYIYQCYYLRRNSATNEGQSEVQVAIAKRALLQMCFFKLSKLGIKKED